MRMRERVQFLLEPVHPAARNPIGAWRVLAAVLLVAPSLFAQGRVSEFLTVQNWHGTVNITGTASGSTSGGIYSDVWQFGITSKVTIQLGVYNPNIQGWTGTYTGTSNVNASDVASFGGCKQTMTQIFQGAVGGAGKTFTLILQGTNQYAFYPSSYQEDGATSSTSNSCTPGTLGGTGPANWSPVLSDKIQTLPASGFILKGSTTVKVDSPMQPMSLVLGGTPAQTDVTIDWDIEPGLAGQNEVVIQRTTAFQNWRPTAGAGGARGNSIDLTAKLQASNGGTTNAKVAYWIWELTNCSKEPGYTMNAPPSSPGTDFDLKLESLAEGVLTPDPAGQRLQSKPGQYTQSTVTIASYDWGAFGTVKVTAVMPDQSQIVGYLEGDSAQTEVRLPMRSANSSIPDKWKQDLGVSTLADNSDNEADPPGDGSPGDGLALYEEYRGFIIDGRHVEGNPKKKDFFLVNTAGAFYLPAFRLFKNLSGMEVHYTLRRAEMSAGRVINFNHGAGAHNGDQHGVVIVPFAADAGYAEAQGGPGTPKSITQVVTPRILPSADSTWIAYLAPTLAHELFHCSNVYHHGDAQSKYGTFYRSSATNTTLFQGIAANVLDESGDAYPLPYDTQLTFQLGMPGDTHGGDDSCVMRYDDARGYFSEADAHTIYLVDAEPAGYSLCTQGLGTGVNAPDRQPQSRYGPSAQGRGNCRGQVLVNDNVQAPTR